MTETVENPPALAPWRDALLIVLLAPALVAGCYSAGFLEFDDSAHYTHAQVMPEYPLSELFAAPHGTYFPVVVLSYRLDRLLFERDPYPPIRASKAAPGVRLHSLLLHVLAGIFLWRALLHLRLGRWMSLFAAAVWTVHPAACESVCWISERKNVLAGFFGFASLWVYFGGVRRPWPRLFATAALFALGMLSKPNTAGYLPIYVLYDALCFFEARFRVSGFGFRVDNGSTRNPKLETRNIAPSVLLYMACVGMILVLAQVNLRMCETATVSRAGGSLWTAALTDVPILVRYIYNSLIPASLSIFYHCTIVTSLASALFWTNLLILILLFAGSVWISPHRARTVFLWGWFYGALGPSLNIIPIPYLMQDRFAYFSLPALLIIAAETVVQLALKLRPNLRRSHAPAYATIGAALCVALMAALRSGVYRNDFELQHDAVLKQPLSTYAHLHYALSLAGSVDLTEYSGRGDPASLAAVREEVLNQLILCEQCDDFDRMLEPGRVRILIAVQHERLGRFELAYPILKEELKQPQKPYNIGVACLSLARIEIIQRRPAEGLVWLDYGMRAMGGPAPSPEMLYLKGICLEDLKRYPEARTAYENIPVSSLAFDRAQAKLSALPH